MLVFGVCGHQGWNQEIKMVEARIQAYWVWSTLLIIAIAVVFFVSSIIMPFVAGMAIAYFLDPLVDKLESIGLSRINSTICVVCSFLLNFTPPLSMFPGNSFNDCPRKTKASSGSNVAAHRTSIAQASAIYIYLPFHYVCHCWLHQWKL